MLVSALSSRSWLSSMRGPQGAPILRRAKFTSELNPCRVPGTCGLELGLPVSFLLETFQEPSDWRAI